MISKILRFELRNRLKQWTTGLFMLMMLVQGVWFSKGYYDFYGGDGMLINSAGVAYQNLAGCGLLLIIVVSIITGPMLYKDIQYKTGGWLYALPIHEKGFFMGRFLAAFLTNSFIGFFYIVGILITPYSGIGEPSLFGPAPIGQMLHGFFILTVPNLFLLTSLCFFALVLFKKPAAGYLAIFLTVISFLLMQTDAETSGFTLLNRMADAFAFVPTSEQIELMSVAERNTSYLSLSGYLLANRLLYLGVALTLLGVAYRKFTFKSFLGASNQKKRSRTTPLAPVPSSPATSKAKLFIPQLQYDTPAFLKKLFTLSRLEFLNLVRPVSFRFIGGIMVLMAVLQNLIWNASYYIGPQFPVTSSMTNFRLTYNVFIIILLMIWAGELFFKDKVVNMWQITDALPVPVWVTQLSRLLAMFGLALVFNAIFMLAGIVSQVALGGAAAIDWQLFFTDFFGYQLGWINQCFYIILAFFLAGLTGRRFLSHVLGVGYFFMLIVAFEFGLMEELRFGFGFAPGVEDYSEMNAYGIWTKASFWYFLTWLSLCVAMVLLGVLFWDRGLAKSLLQKLRFQGTQLNWAGKLAIPLALVGFFFLQSFIVRQVNELDNFSSSAEEETTSAAYERSYRHLKSLPQPVYAHLEGDIAFYPEARNADCEFTAYLRNLTSIVIDTLYLSFPEKVRLKELRWNEQSVTDYELDETHDVLILPLPSPLDSLGKARLDLRFRKGFEGFSQGDPQEALVFRGSFGSIDDYLPFIGYDDGKQLDENRTRVSEGLTRLTSLMPAIDDSAALRRDSYRPDALPMISQWNLSTDANQQLVGPGKLTRTWVEADRRYATFAVESPTSLRAFFGTAPYVLDEQSAATLYYWPDHTYNVARYQSLIQAASAFIAQQWGEAPAGPIRLYEIPRYHQQQYAFPQGIAISERDGWFADTANLKERAYLALSIASAMGEQWVQQNLRIAQVQGADMLRVALPEALGLQFVKELYGKEAVELLRDPKLQQYNKNRHSDPNGEPPLLYADGKDYLEANWGALNLYDWSKELGQAKFYQPVMRLAQAEIPVTFAQLYQTWLKSTSNPKRKAFWQERMEQVHSK